MAKPKHLDATTNDKVFKYQQLIPLLSAMVKEFQDAARKKPEAALNKKKVEIVNRLLRDVLSVLEDEVSRAYLDLLDEDDMPQNSDVSLMLGQIMAAMEAFKDKYYRYNSEDFSHHWQVRDGSP